MTKDLSNVDLISNIETANLLNNIKIKKHAIQDLEDLLVSADVLEQNGELKDFLPKLDDQLQIALSTSKESKFSFENINEIKTKCQVEILSMIEKGIRIINSYSTKQKYIKDCIDKLQAALKKEEKPLHKDIESLSNLKQIYKKNIELLDRGLSTFDEFEKEKLDKIIGTLKKYEIFESIKETDLSNIGNSEKVYNYFKKLLDYYVKENINIILGKIYINAAISNENIDAQITSYVTRYIQNTLSGLGKSKTALELENNIEQLKSDSQLAYEKLDTTGKIDDSLKKYKKTKLLNTIKDAISIFNRYSKNQIYISNCIELLNEKHKKDKSDINEKALKILTSVYKESIEKLDIGLNAYLEYEEKTVNVVIGKIRANQAFNKIKFKKLNQINNNKKIFNYLKVRLLEYVKEVINFAQDPGALDFPFLNKVINHLSFANSAKELKDEINKLVINEKELDDILGEENSEEDNLCDEEYDKYHLQNFENNGEDNPDKYDLSNADLEKLYEKTECILRSDIKAIVQKHFQEYFLKPKIIDDLTKNYNMMVLSKEEFTIDNVKWNDIKAAIKYFKPLSEAQAVLKNTILSWLSNSNIKKNETAKKVIYLLIATLYQVRKSKCDDNLLDSMRPNNGFFQKVIVSNQYDQSLELIIKDLLELKDKILKNMLFLVPNPAQKNRKSYIFRGNTDDKALTQEEHLQYFGNLIEPFIKGKSYKDNASSSIQSLLMGCGHLASAALLNSKEAKEILGITGDVLLAPSIIRRAADRLFYNFLKSCPETSDNYNEAQLNLSFHYYGLRYSKIYANYDDRLKDIYLAIKHLLNVTQEDYQPYLKALKELFLIKDHELLDEESIKKSAYTLLLLELCGEDPLSALFNSLEPGSKNPEHPPYHFKISKTALREILTRGLRPGEDKICIADKVRDTIETHLDNTLTIYRAKKLKTSSYELSISANSIENNASGTIVFFDKDSNEEVARITKENGNIYFNGFGNDIKLSVVGSVKVKSLVIEDIKSELILDADIKSDEDINVISSAPTTLFKGKIEARNIRLNNNNMTLDADASLLARQDVLLSANRALLKGEVKGNQCFIDLRASLEQDSNSSIVTTNDLNIKANSFKKIQGRICSKKNLNVYCQDGIYLKGRGNIFANGKLVVQGKSLLATNKSRLESNQAIYLDIASKIIADKLCEIKSPQAIIQSPNIKNYSPNLVFNSANIHAEKEFINYSTGIIKTNDQLTLSGGSFWNGGQVAFGENLNVYMNKLFVHGLSDFHTVTNNHGREEEGFWQSIKNKNKSVGSRIVGKNANVIAGVYLNVLSLLLVHDFNLSSIAEVNIGGSATVNSLKNRLIALDVGINVPNVVECAKDISEFINYIRNNEFDKAVKFICSINNLTKAASCVKWFIEIIFPVLSKPINLVWNIILLIATSPQLIKEIYALYKQKDSIEPYQITALAASIGGVFNQGFNLGTQIKNFTNPSTLPEINTKDVLTGLGLNLATLALPSASNQALLDMRLGGVNLSGSIQNRSLFSYSAWNAEIALTISNLFYRANLKSKIDIANILSNEGHDLKKSGFEIALNNFSDVTNRNDSSHIYANNMRWKGEELILSKRSKLNAKNVVLDQKQTRLAGEADAETFIAKSRDEITLNNKLSCENLYLISEDSDIILDDNTINVKPTKSARRDESLYPQILFSANNVTQKKSGRINASGVTGCIEANNLQLSGDNKLDLYANIKDYFKLSGTYAGHDLHVAADKAIIDGKIKIFDINSNTRREKPQITISGNSLDIRNSSNIDAPSGTIVLDEKNINASGHINVHNLSAEADRFQKFSGNVSVDEMFLTGNVIYADGPIQFKHNNKEHYFAADAKTTFQMSSHGNIVGKGSVSVKAPTATLGHIDADNLAFEFNHIDNLNDFITCEGTYRDLHPHESIYISTNDHLDLKDNFDLPYGLTIAADSLDITGDIHSAGNLGFIAKNSDVKTTGNHLKADGVLFIESQKKYVNEKGDICGGELYIHTQGDAINNAGIWRSPFYVEIDSAHGNIINRCYESDVRGKYGIVKSYEPANIFGGSGAGHAGIGLSMHASEKVINDASIIYSLGDNLISGDKGVESIARYNKYLSYYKHWNNFWGEKTTKEYSTQVQPAFIYSLQGKNTIVSKNGGIHSVATDFYAPLGHHFHAKENIVLEGIIANTECEKKQTGWFGMTHDNSKQYDEYAVPTYIIDLADSRIISDENIEITNAFIAGTGDLDLQGKNVILSAPILNHTFQEDKREFGIKLPSWESIPGYALYKDISALHSSKNIGILANTWNLGVDTLLTANNAINAFRSGDISSYGSSLLPELTYTHTKTKINEQSVADNVGIQKDSLHITADNDVAFKNGCPVDIKNDSSIKAKNFMQTGAELHHSFTSESQGLNAGVSLDGTPHVGASVNATKESGTSHQNQVFNVGGELAIETEEWDMNAANTNAGSIKGNIKQFMIESPLDKNQQESYSAHVDTNGSFGANFSKYSKRYIECPSGLHVKDGINNNGENNFNVDHVALEGGKILADGVNNFHANSIEARDVEEYHQGYGFGFDFNAKDFVNAGNMSIPVWNVNASNKDYQARQHGTIFGGAGTNVSTPAITGRLYTSDSNGVTVNKNVDIDINLRIPIFNDQNIHNMQDNFDWLLGREHVVNKPENKMHHPTAHKGKQPIKGQDEKKASASSDSQLNDEELSQTIDDINHLDFDLTHKASDVVSDLTDANSNYHQERREAEAFKQAVDAAIHMPLPDLRLNVNDATFKPSYSHFDFQDTDKKAPEFDYDLSHAYSKAKAKEHNLNEPFIYGRDEDDALDSKIDFSQSRYIFHPSYEQTDVFQPPQYNAYDWMTAKELANTSICDANVVKYWNPVGNESNPTWNQVMASNFWDTVDKVNAFGKGLGESVFYPAIHPVNTYYGVLALAQLAGQITEDISMAPIDNEARQRLAETGFLLFNGAKNSAKAFYSDLTSDDPIKQYGAYGTLAGALVPSGFLLGKFGVLGKLTKGGESKVTKAISKYPKQVEQYSNLTEKQLEKAIKSHEKQILLHEDKLANPENHISNWNEITSQHQQSLVTRWNNDIARHQSYSEIAKHILQNLLERAPKNGR